MALKLSEDDARRLGIKLPGKSSAKNSTPRGRSRQQVTASKSPPQDQLWNALKWDPNTREFPWQWEYAGAIPGRRFSIDIALVLSDRHKLALEVDGMRHHGISREGFYRDREKDFLLEANAWRIVRIPAGMISKDLGGVLDRITQVIRQVHGHYLRDQLERLPAGYTQHWRRLCVLGYPTTPLIYQPLPGRAGWFQRHHTHPHCSGGHLTCVF